MYPKFRKQLGKGITLLFLGAFLLIGASLMGMGGCATAENYPQEVNNVSTNVIKEYDEGGVWDKRIDDDVYKGNVAFTAYVGEGKNRQTELFVGKIDDDGNVKDIKRLTYTPECEVGPIFTDTLRIDYGMGKSTLLKDIEHTKWFRINKDGTNIQQIDFMTWQNEYSRNHR